MKFFLYGTLTLAVLCTACSDATGPDKESAPPPENSDDIQIKLNFDASLPPLFTYENLPNDWCQYFFGVAFDVNNSGRVDTGDLFIANSFTFDPYSMGPSLEYDRANAGGKAYFIGTPGEPIEVARFDAVLTTANQLTLSIPKANLDVYEAVRSATGIRAINYYYYGMTGSFTPEHIFLNDDFPGDIETGATTDTLLSNIEYHDLKGDFIKSVSTNSLNTTDASLHLDPESTHLDLLSVAIYF